VPKTYIDWETVPYEGFDLTASGAANSNYSPSERLNIRNYYFNKRDPLELALIYIMELNRKILG